MDVFGGAPRFLAYPRPLVVQSGTDAVLKCQIGGDPRPAVIWERNNEKLDPQGRYRVFEDGNVYNLIITAVTIEDSGQYICKAKNSIGETYAAATLKVEGEAQEMELREENKPRFLIKPLSTRAGRGEDAVFSCKIWGNPKPDVVWEKDGKKLNEIFESTHFSVGSQDGGWFQLKIFKTRAPDGGVYTCKARNEFGEALAGAVLLVDAGPSHEDEANRNGYTNGHWKTVPGRCGRPAPNRVNETMTKTAKVKMFAVTEGKHAKFRCFVTGKPKPEIIWRKDGRLILSGRRYLLYEDREGYFTLKVLYCKQKDNGVYVCAASNTAGQTLSAVHLSVKEPPVQFKQPLIDLEVWERDLAVLECEVPEDSVPITWYLEDRRLQPGAKYGMEQWGTKRRLTIRDIGVDDDGIYLCEMPDGGRSIAEVAVKGTILRKLPRKVDVLEGENAAFCVEVEKEEMDIHWYKDGVELRETHQTILKSFGRTHILVFVNTNPQDTGQVMFLVGRSKTSSQLRVKAARHCPPSAPVGVQINTERANAALLSWIPAQDSRKNPPSGYVLERQEVGTGSQEWLQCLTTDSATSVEILGDSVPCEADYHFRICSVNKYGKSNNVEFPRTVHLVPAARIQAPLQDALVPEGQDALFSIELTASVIGTWFLNGTQIQEDERFSMRRTRTHQSLRIRGVRDTDNGAEITFIAYGIRDSAVLYIQAPLVKFSPLSEMDRNKFVEIGNPIVLYCELSDPAAPVHWYKNGVELGTTEGLHIQSEGTMRRIVIQSAEFCHSGVYCCDAIDDVIRFNVEVEAPPVRFSVISEAERCKKVHCGQSLLLQCEVSEPSAQVHWYKDGAKLPTQSGLDIMSEGLLRTLVIHSSEMYHSGLYTCKTKGDSITFSVDVTAPPVTFAPLSEEARCWLVSLGAAIKLCCAVSDPEASVRWFHGDTELGPDSGCEIQADGVNRAVIVQSVEMCHSGIYTCTTDDDTVEFTVEVQAIPAPTVFERMGSLEAVRPLELECEVTDFAVSLCWFKDDQPLPKQSTVLEEMKDRDTRNLIVLSPESLHSDLNGSETSEATVHATVDHKAEKKSPLEGPSSIVQQFEISDPVAKAVWFKDGTQIFPQRYDPCNFLEQSDSQQLSGSPQHCFSVSSSSEKTQSSVQTFSFAQSHSPELSSYSVRSVRPEQTHNSGESLASVQQHCNIYQPQSPAMSTDPVLPLCFSTLQPVICDSSDLLPAIQTTKEKCHCVDTESSEASLNAVDAKAPEAQLKNPKMDWPREKEGPDDIQYEIPMTNTDPEHSRPSPSLPLPLNSALTSIMDTLQKGDLYKHFFETKPEFTSRGQLEKVQSIAQTVLRDQPVELLCNSITQPLLTDMKGQLGRHSKYLQSTVYGPLKKSTDQVGLHRVRTLSEPGEDFIYFTQHRASPREDRSPTVLQSTEQQQHAIKPESSGVLSQRQQTSPITVHQTNINLDKQICVSKHIQLNPHMSDVGQHCPQAASVLPEDVDFGNKKIREDPTSETNSARETQSFFHKDSLSLLDLQSKSEQFCQIAQSASVQPEHSFNSTSVFSVQEDLYSSSHPTAAKETSQNVQMVTGLSIADQCQLKPMFQDISQKAETHEINNFPTNKVHMRPTPSFLGTSPLLSVENVPSLNKDHPSIQNTLNGQIGLYSGQMAVTDSLQFVSDIQNQNYPSEMSQSLMEPLLRTAAETGHQKDEESRLHQGKEPALCRGKEAGLHHNKDNRHVSDLAPQKFLKEASAVGQTEESNDPEEFNFSQTFKENCIDRLTENKVADEAWPVKINALGATQMSCEAGKALDLLCEVSNEKARVTWFKDGVELYGEDTIQIQSESSKRRLTIPSAASVHSGVYSCHTADETVHFTVDIKAPLCKFSALSEAEQKKTVMEGSPLALQCELSDASGLVTWYKDGAALLPESGVDIQTEGHKRSVYVPSAERQHSGVYRCKSKDDDIQFTVNIRDLKPTVTFLELNDTDRRHLVLESCPVVLQCQLSQESSTEVSWSKDGVRIYSDHDVKIQEQGLSCTLTIHSAKPQDSGIYQCSTIGDKIEFEVAIKGRTPYILPIVLSDTHKLVSLGSPIVLQCEVSEPGAQVSWAKDQVELFCKTGLDMKRDGCLRKLMVHSAKSSDAGMYSCSLGNNTVMFRVDIQAFPVQFSQLPEVARNKFVEADCPIVLQCEVSEPEAQVVWYKNGQLLPLQGKPNGQSDYELQSTDCLRTLVIQAAAVQHSGLYSCQAANNSITFKVDVAAVAEANKDGEAPDRKAGVPGQCPVTPGQSKNKSSHFSDVETHQSQPNTSIPASCCKSGKAQDTIPTVFSETQSPKAGVSKDQSVSLIPAPPVTFMEISEEDLLKNVMEQEELVLSCEVSSPEGAVTWYRDGAEIQSSDSVRIEVEGTIRRLTIHSAQLTDSGTFSCQTGDNMLLFKVTVREPLVMIVHPKEDVHLERHVPEEIILSCELSRSNGAVYWFKDGQKLQESENIKLKVEGPYRRLKILSCRVEDSGEYVCDTDDDSIFFQLNITEPPVRIVSPSQSQMELCQQTSERMVLSCEISRPNAIVRWYRDGLEVEENQNLLIEEDGVYRRLIIPKTTVSDSAEYVCDTADDSMTFFVNIAEPPVRFVRPRKTPSKVEKATGESVVLDCEVSRASADVTWKKNGEEVEESTNISLLGEGVSRQLTIHCVTPEDAGQYVCDAKDDLMDFTLTIKEPPVRIVGKPEGRTEKQFVVADDIVLVCELSRVNASVTWSKDGCLIEDSERVCSEVQGVFRSLVVLSAELGDSGEYSCDTGDDSLSFHITVKEPPVKIVANSGVPEHHLLLAGEDLLFECEVSRPDAEVQWLRNGEVLQSDERVQIESFDVVRKFVMFNLQPSDSGEYTCDALDDKMIMILEVQEPPATFLNKPSSPCTLTAVEGDSLTLSAELSREQNVRWLKDGELLNADNIHISSSGATQCLTLHPLQLCDSGEFVCEAPNDHMSFSVLVREMKVKFIRPLQNMVALKGQSLTLQCEVNKPKGDVQWLKNGQDVVLCRKFTIRAHGRERSFTIHEVTPEDAGEYSCASTDDRTTATVMVQAPRVVEFIAGLRNVTVREGEDAVFKCVVSPEDATLVWKINGHPPPSQRATITKNGTCHTLHLCRCAVGDSGQVTADAEGQVSRAELQVQEPQVVFTRQMRAITAEEFGEAVLEVEVSQDSGEVQWMRQGVLLHEGSKYSLLTSGQTHSLKIHTLALSDSGRYSCETLHDRTQALLTVLARKISIRRGLSDIRTTERETASFEVLLSHPAVTGTWFRNGTQLKPGAHYRISSKNLVHSLTICNLSVEDTGTFMFSVENLKTSARLVVKEPPVTIFRKLEDQKFPDGAVISIECELSRHNVDVKWLKNGVEVKPCKELRIYAMGRKRFLQVMKCKVSDSGVYSCDAGDATTSCTVEVYERELLILQELEDLEMEEDQNAVFMCELSVEDVPGEWFKKGVRIHPTSTIKIRQEGTKHFLLMCNVRPEDSGEIKFVARNVESVAYLDVEELPVNIVKPLQDQTVLEKTRVLLDCMVSTPRCSCRWYKGVNVILPSERFEICSEGCTRKLIIQQVALEDEGMYSVQVGEHSCSAKLSVEAQSVSVVRGLSDVEVICPAEACFEVEVSVPVQGSPVWALNGVQLQPSPRVLIEKMGTVHRLTFRQTSEETSGDLEFIINGKTRSTAKLSVITDPE